MSVGVPGYRRSGHRAEERAWWSAVQFSGAGAFDGAGWARSRPARWPWRSPSRGAAASVLGGGTAAPSTDAAAEASARTPPSGQAGAGQVLQPEARLVRLPGFQCARLTVPLDYAKPDGATAPSRCSRPGPRGTAAARWWSTPAARAARGCSTPRRRTSSSASRCATATTSSGSTPAASARSQPVTCLDDRQLDAFLGEDPTPDTQAEEQSFVANAKDFAAKCAAKRRPAAGARLHDRGGQGHGHPAGRARLTPSWTTWASPTAPSSAPPTPTCSPTKVGRFVLDGVVAPDLSSTQVNQGQAEGFETATRAYVADCVKGGGCPLGSSVDEGMQRLRDFLKQLDTAPITGRRPARRQADRGLGLARDRRGDVRREQLGLADAGARVGLQGRRQRPDGAGRQLRRARPRRAATAAT